MESLEVKLMKYSKILTWVLSTLPTSQRNYKYKEDNKKCVDTINLRLFQLPLKLCLY